MFAIGEYTYLRHVPATVDRARQLEDPTQCVLCTSGDLHILINLQSKKNRYGKHYGARTYSYEARHARYIPQDKKGLSLNRLKKKKRMVQVTSSMVHVTVHGIRSSSPPTQTELTRNFCVSHGSPAPEFGSHVRPSGGPSTAHAGGSRVPNWWDPASDTVMVTRPQWSPR